MTVRAKTLVKDKFWIVEQDGHKLGTLQKQENNGWTFLTKTDKPQVFHTQESLFSKFVLKSFDGRLGPFRWASRWASLFLALARPWQGLGLGKTYSEPFSVSYILSYSIRFFKFWAVLDAK